MSDETTDPALPSPQPEPPRRGQPRPAPPRASSHRATRLLLWVTAIGLLILVAATAALVVLLQDGEDPLADNQGRWVYVGLAGLSDAPEPPGLFDDPNDMPPMTTEVVQMLHDAADDPEVPGLVVEVGSSALGWAQTQELRDALLAFRAAGKPCVAWADTYGNREYFLATACDEVQVFPTGLVLPNGLALTQTYFAGALEKIDVHANFEHVGDFKSAVEPYERTGPSDAASEATSLLLDGLYGELVKAIAQGRGVSEEQAAAWVDDPPMTAEQALEMGLVDRLSFKDQLRDQVELYGGTWPADGTPADVSEESRLELRHYRDYLSKQRRAWKKSQEVTVAVIYAEGAIMPGDSTVDIFGGKTIGDRTVRSQLQQVREDEEVDAVVLRVNSPGGSGSASDAIWREVVLTRQDKPLVVSMSDYAASGGYYISMAADHIVAEPTTLTGSIGVFGGKMNVSGAMGKLGLSQHTWERGEHATLLSGTHDFDEGDRALFRRYLESFYGTFVTKAAEGRGMSYDELHAVAQGRVWTGTQALERGLVDELGGLDVAIQRAVERLELAEAPAEVRIVRIPERKGLLDQLLEDMGKRDRNIGNSEAPSALQARVEESLQPEQALLHELTTGSPEVRAALSGALQLQRIVGTGEAALMLPGVIDIR